MDAEKVEERFNAELDACHSVSFTELPVNEAVRYNVASESLETVPEVHVTSCDDDNAIEVVTSQPNNDTPSCSKKLPPKVTVFLV